VPHESLEPFGRNGHRRATNRENARGSRPAPSDLPSDHLWTIARGSLSFAGRPRNGPHRRAVHRRARLQLTGRAVSIFERMTLVTDISTHVG